MKEKIASVKQERWSIGDLNPAEYNPRKTLRPGDEEYESLKKSIQTFGYVDPIIVNHDGTVIGGHQRLNVLIDLGYSEVDVAVVNLSKSDEKALNVALNKISGEWDDEKLAALFLELQAEDYDTDSTGFNGDEISNLLGNILNEEQEIEDKYSKKIATPVYEITGETPDISELCDLSKYHSLLDDIEHDMNISEEERDFLRLAASRHIVFDYGNIAEYYAASSPAMQGLMEDSALVIIDFEKAIEGGFVKLSKLVEGIVEDVKSKDGDGE